MSIAASAENTRASAKTPTSAMMSAPNCSHFTGPIPGMERSRRAAWLRGAERPISSVIRVTRIR